MNNDTTLTYILVDFENVQQLDMGLLSGEHYHLRIFRGPHQKKLDFDIVESLQPHGTRVQYIQSDRHGKNALDFHIAFHMGRLIEALEANGSHGRENTRFVVISKDGGFDALMSHVRSLGYGAMKGESIRQALGLTEPGIETGIAAPPMQSAAAAPTTQTRNSSPLPSLAVKKSASEKSAPAKKPATAKPAVPKKKAAAPQVNPPAKAASKSQAPARKSLGPEDKDKVLENLRLHPKNRPVKRKSLESHIKSVVGGNVAAKAVRGLIAGLENEKIVEISDDKIVQYRIPTRKK